MGAIQIHNAERDALQIPDRQAYEHYHEPLGDFGVYNGQFEQGLAGRYANDLAQGVEGWQLFPDVGGTVDRVNGGLAGNWRLRGGNVGMGQGGSAEGWKYIPVDENHALRPKTPYAFNKTAAENMYLFYSDVYNIPCVCFRIANPYGIRSQMKHSKYSIVNYFIRMAMEDKTITIFGDGEQLRDYVYVEDLAEAFILAAINDDVDGHVYNVGSGVGTKFKDMVKMVVEVVGKGAVAHVPWPDDYLNVETGDYITDLSKISKMLDWHPSLSLRKGIEKTFAYYEKYKAYYF